MSWSLLLLGGLPAVAATDVHNGLTASLVASVSSLVWLVGLGICMCTSVVVAYVCLWWWQGQEEHTVATVATITARHVRNEQFDYSKPRVYYEGQWKLIP